MMNEIDCSDPGRYAESEAALRQLRRRMKQHGEARSDPTSNDFIMVVLATVFLYGQLFAAWLKMLG